MSELGTFGRELIFQEYVQKAQLGILESGDVREQLDLTIRR